MLIAFFDRPSKLHEVGQIRSKDIGRTELQLAMHGVQDMRSML
jgi:hypothetical protein